MDQLPMASACSFDNPSLVSEELQRIADLRHTLMLVRAN
jgi:hypothetical protein